MRLYRHSLVLLVLLELSASVTVIAAFSRRQQPTSVVIRTNTGELGDVITGWAEALTRYISHNAKYRKMADLDPRGTKTPQPIHNN